jgi:predicted Zn-dependent peptidase
MKLHGPALTSLLVGTLLGQAPGYGTGSVEARVTAYDEAVEADSISLPPVRATVLSNGLTVLSLHRPGAPTAAMVVQYGVGGVNEVPGQTGIAHLLEHMLFKGTESMGTRNPEAEERLLARADEAHDSLLALRALPAHGDPAMEEEARRLRQRISILEDSARSHSVPNEFSRILSREGARGLNAVTTSETTTYFVEIPSNRAELWFALEADRMANPVFREFYTERDVVMEERRLRVETSPSGLLYETHLALAYRAHPYGQPVVGHMSDLESLSRRDLETYYRRFYGAGNAVVVVVGNVPPDSVHAWARRYLGSLPEGEPSRPVLTREPEQKGERRAALVLDAQPSLRMGWHVPDAAHPDAAALSMMSMLLTGGRTARLQKRLVQDQRLAASISSSVVPGRRYPGLFVISAEPRAPHTTRDLEEAIQEEIRRLAEIPPTPDELRRVRTQIEASRVRRLRTNLGLALQLAEGHTVRGDWTRALLDLEDVAGVRPEDVARVADRYFASEHLSVATVVPSDEARGEAR